MNYTLEYLAGYLQARLIPAPGRSEAEVAGIEIRGIGACETASANQITFVTSAKYGLALGSTRAAAVILREVQAGDCQTNSLVVGDPYLAYARLSALFAEPYPAAGIHSSAQVDASAEIGNEVYIGPTAVVEAGARLADQVVVGAGASIGMRVRVGRSSVLHANVVLYQDVQLGADCIVHAGAVIGADGFGFAPRDQGYEKIHQLGAVVIGNRVEIGANACIDRGALGDTRIGDGVKIDNLVHVAHNCTIGADTAVAAQAGLAGSTGIGENCTIGGQVGFAGHLELTDNVQINGQSRVSKSIKQPGHYSSGTPMMDVQSWRRNAVRFSKLDTLYRRVDVLEKSRKED